MRTPSPISRDRPHCSTLAYEARADAIAPSPISRDRPHCSGDLPVRVHSAYRPSPISRDRASIAAGVVGEPRNPRTDHHRSLGIGLIAAHNTFLSWFDDGPSPISRDRPHCSPPNALIWVNNPPPSPISRDRPHCSADPTSAVSGSAPITDLCGIGLIAARTGRRAAWRSCSPPSPISRDRPHAAGSSRARWRPPVRHHRSLGIGLIAACPSGRRRRPRLPSPISRDRPHCSYKRYLGLTDVPPITDLSGSASLQQLSLGDRDQLGHPSPISRDRPHCSIDMGTAALMGGSHHRSLGIGLIAPAAVRDDGHLSCAITDLSGSASFQRQPPNGSRRIRPPSPISRDRPHCSLRNAFTPSQMPAHHRSLGIGHIAACPSWTGRSAQRCHNDLSGSAILQRR